MEMELRVQLNSLEILKSRLRTGCPRHGEERESCCKWQISDLSN